MARLHPLVQQVGPSPEQCSAVMARERDVVLTAGAGTGKTRTLVARYLDLLAEDVPVRGLVAITFTQKAAREMRNRVRDELRAYLVREDLGDDERSFWQERYEALDGARISTIHSLCSEILRSHPERLEIDPSFAVLTEGAMALLKQRAVDEALAWAADDPEAAASFALLGERALTHALRTLLNDRLRADEIVARLPDDLLGHWRQVFRRESKLAWARLKDDPIWSEAYRTLVNAQPLDITDRMAIQRKLALDALARVRLSESEWDPAPLATLGAIKLTGGRQTAWSGGKGELGAVKDALKAVRERWRAYRGAVMREATGADKALADTVPALVACYRQAAKRYEQAKRDELALDYDDLERGALELLEHRDVRSAWQSRVNAILVDEFQDTNDRQRAIVRRLCAAPGQLFVVGDAKQSIYRFRGADVVVFREERQRIEREGTAHILTTTYRAHPRLLAALNALLAPILGEAADPTRPWVEPFQRLTAVPREPRLRDMDAYVELHLVLGSKGDGALNRAAAAVVERLVALVEGGDGELGYGDIAILCRASSAFESYENALERAGVPSLTVAGRGFYQRPRDGHTGATWWQYLRSGDAPRLRHEQATLRGVAATGRSHARGRSVATHPARYALPGGLDCCW